MKLSEIGGAPQSDQKTMKLSQVGQQDSPKLSSTADSVGQDMLNTFGGEIEGAWNKLRTDFETTMPNKNYINEDFWNKLKDDYRQTVAAGSLPIDAFNLVISPIAGAIKAGPVKAVAAGERAAIGALPGIDKSKLPSQSDTENQLMGDLSAIAPEKGVSLAAPASAAVPTVDALKTAARKAYTIADSSGMQIEPHAIKSLHGTIAADLAKKGFHEKLMPKTDVAVNEIKAMAEDKNPKSLQDIDVLRRIAGHAAGASEKADRTMARVVKDHIDDFVDNLGPQHLTGTKDNAAIDALHTARDAWKRASKGEIIEGAIEKAKTNASQFSQSGVENALRVQFRKIVNNDRAMSRFTPEEREAIKQVAKGGPITNALRMIGKLAPHGIVSLGLSSGGGYAVGGPVGMLAVPAIGEAGRLAATAMTERNARLASELVRRGAKPQVSAASGAQKIYPAASAANVLQPRSARDVVGQLAGATP
jgi:hypothetical protein